MTAITANDLDQEGGEEGPNPLRNISYYALAIAVLAIAATTMTAPAEAGSCTGYAALETPLLPVVV